MDKNHNYNSNTQKKKKKNHSYSSKVNIESIKNNSLNNPLNNKFQKNGDGIQSMKQTQSSFPFYMPKSKYCGEGKDSNANRSTASTNIMSEFPSAKFEDKRKVVSPFKRQFPDSKIGHLEGQQISHQNNKFQGVTQLK